MLTTCVFNRILICSDVASRLHRLLILLCCQHSGHLLEIVFCLATINNTASHFWHLPAAFPWTSWCLIHAMPLDVALSLFQNAEYFLAFYVDKVVFFLKMQLTNNDVLPTRIIDIRFVLRASCGHFRDFCQHCNVNQQCIIGWTRIVEWIHTLMHKITFCTSCFLTLVDT